MDAAYGMVAIEIHSTQHDRIHLVVQFDTGKTQASRRLEEIRKPFEADNCSNCDNCTSAPAALTDITIPAQKLLSCVKRTGEKFGAVHIADVLLGSMNEKVVKFGHDKVSTHGIGKELNQKQWTRLARQLEIHVRKPDTTHQHR